MEWFYAKDGKQEGPVDLATLQGKLESGELSPTDLIWKEGMAEWTPAEKVPEVAPGAAVPAATPADASASTPVAAPAGMASPVAAAAGPPTSGLAIASMVLGIIGLISCYVHAVFALPAVICGHMAAGRIKNSPDEVGGRGMATAGIVMGYIGLLFQVLTIVFVLFFFTRVSTIQEQMDEQLQEEMERQSTQF